MARWVLVPARLMASWPDSTAPVSGGHAVALARQLTTIVGNDASTALHQRVVLGTPASSFSGLPADATGIRAALPREPRN
jgi:hypothetical protein